MAEFESQASAPAVELQSNSAKLLKSVVIGTLCFVLAFLLVAGGLAIISTRAKSIDSPVAESSIHVSVVPVTRANGYVRVTKHIGLVEPLRQTDLSFETGGTLTAVLVKEGELVRQGQRIAQLDIRSLTTDRTAQLAMRKAQLSDLESAKLSFERQQVLQARDFAAGQSFDDARLLVTRSEALIEQTNAIISAIDIALDKATLRAPFDAQVGQQTVTKGTTVNAGTPIASVFETQAPVVRIGLPVATLLILEQQADYSVAIDGQEYPASLISTRNDVSARTRTIDVRLQLDVTNRVQPAFGQTAELSLEQYIEEPGYQVPVTALTEGEEGLWSLLLTVADEPGSVSGHVTREHIDILYTNGDIAFVQGDLRTDAGIIRTGTHRVVPGQRVLSTTDSL